MDEKRAFVRHTLATLAYRATRSVEGCSDEFGNFDGGGKSPAQILAHMGDLFDWALSIANGAQRWKDSEPLPWAEEKQRFFAALSAFEARLADDKPIDAPLERLFQGPIADALTHVGQLAMLRRLAGEPVKGENFYVAEVVVGRLDEDQALRRKKI
jgi:hypothetical protein